MQLTGTFKGSKSGTFKPDDSDTAYPYVYAKVVDEDGDGGWTKVKPGPDQEPAEFGEVLKAIKSGDTVVWTVIQDNYGNIRFVGALG